MAIAARKQTPPAAPPAADRLEASRARLAEVHHQIDLVEAHRREALLRDDDVTAEGLATDLETLRRAEQAQRDKVALLELAVKREADEALAKRRVALTDQFEQILAQADTAADELQSALARVEAKFREVIELRERARLMWPSGDSHSAAIASTVEGCAMSGGAIQTLIAHELYRVSHRPFFGGTPGAKGEWSLPGSSCPRLEWSMMPEKITPLATALRNCSAFARSRRCGSSTRLWHSPQRIATAPGLSDLLSRQAKLAASPTPSNEAEYQAVVAAIAAHNDGASP